MSLISMNHQYRNIRCEAVVLDRKKTEFINMDQSIRKHTSVWICAQFFLFKLYMK